MHVCVCVCENMAFFCFVKVQTQWFCGKEQSIHSSSSSASCPSRWISDDLLEQLSGNLQSHRPCFVLMSEGPNPQTDDYGIDMNHSMMKIFNFWFLVYWVSSNDSELIQWEIFECLFFVKFTLWYIFDLNQTKVSQ